jgi:hypothetical protein
MSDEAPIRLIASADDPALRALLEAGRDELASDAQTVALAAKMGPLLGGGGGGGAAGGGAGPGKVLGKVAEAGALKASLWGGGALALAVVVAGVTAGVAVRQATKVEPARSTALASGIASAEAPASAAPVAPPWPGDSAEVAAVPAAKAAVASASTPTFVAAAAPDPADEVKLLQRAEDALKSDPSRALALCDEHARRYPGGLLGQESEVIAIEALTRMGKRAEAKARAHAFASHFPTSAHLGRIAKILGEDP